MVYNDEYHFGVTDYYAATRLKEVGYVEKAEKIAGNYGYKLGDVSYGYDHFLQIDTIQIDDDTDTEHIAKAVKEILNCVEMPKVNRPIKTSFSTKEVGFHSNPVMTYLMIGLKSPGGVETSARFKLADKDESVYELKKTIDAYIADLSYTDEVGFSNTGLKEYTDFYKYEGEMIELPFAQFMSKELL